MQTPRAWEFQGKGPASMKARVWGWREVWGLSRNKKDRVHGGNAAGDKVRRADRLCPAS